MNRVVLAMMASLLVAIAGCGGGAGGSQRSFTYKPIPGVPQAVNDLGRLIGQEQRNVVTPGGTLDDPGFSAADQTSFDSSNRLATVVSQVKANPTFAAGVAALRPLPSSTQQTTLAAFSVPIDPTWSQTGIIGDGTTDAGQAVEQEIATALSNAVDAAL